VFVQYTGRFSTSPLGRIVSSAPQFQWKLPTQVQSRSAVRRIRIRSAAQVNLFCAGSLTCRRQLTAAPNRKRRSASVSCFALAIHPPASESLVMSYKQAPGRWAGRPASRPVQAADVWIVTHAGRRDGRRRDRTGGCFRLFLRPVWSACSVAVEQGFTDVGLVASSDGRMAFTPCSGTVSARRGKPGSSARRPTDDTTSAARYGVLVGVGEGSRVLVGVLVGVFVGVLVGVIVACWSAYSSACWSGCCLRIPSASAVRAVRKVNAVWVV